MYICVHVYRFGIFIFISNNNEKLAIAMKSGTKLSYKPKGVGETASLGKNNNQRKERKD